MAGFVLSLLGAGIVVVAVFRVFHSRWQGSENAVTPGDVATGQLLAPPK